MYKKTITAPNNYCDDFVLLKNSTITTRHSSFYKAGSNQQLFQRYYKVQNKWQEILSQVKTLKFKSSCWRSLFSFFPSYFWYHKGLERWKGFQALKDQTPRTIKQHDVWFTPHWVLWCVHRTMGEAGLKLRKEWKFP